MLNTSLKTPGEHSKTPETLKSTENLMMSDEEAYEWMHYMGAITDVASYMKKYGKGVVLSDLERALESLVSPLELRYSSDPRSFGPDSDGKE